MSSTGTRRYSLRKRAQTMAATRRRITEAAVALHGSVGPARTTITAVAARAGVQRQTVYRHFATEDELLAACSGHFSATHPWPSPHSWRAIADPAQRLSQALHELYAYYERTDAMWTNVLRDEPLVAAVGPTLAPFRAFLDDAARTLAVDWPNPAQKDNVVVAATRHAVDFHTWRSLARDGGIDRPQAIELTSAMIRRATQG